jgi:septin family protein
MKIEDISKATSLTIEEIKNIKKAVKNRIKD